MHIKTQALPIVERAEVVATVAHHDQVLPSGEPVVDHLRRIVAGIDPADEQARVVAWLHHIGTSSVTVEMVRAQFGDEVADAVDALSGGSDQDRLARVCSNRLASVVQLACLTVEETARIA